MTIEEKIDIISLDYDSLVNKRLLVNTNAKYNIYEEGEKVCFGLDHQKKKYDDIFGTKHGKLRLKSMINMSRNIECLWEFPRGRGSTKIKESDIETAIREVYEETKIHNSEYYILHNAPTFRLEQYGNNLKYESVYYPAFMKKPKSNISIDFNDYQQIVEITDIKFVPINELKNYNIDNKHEFIKYANYIKKKHKLYMYYSIGTTDLL
jgi:8-oxo-dGTP pyrophosphatase MutT (NUDIX family)